MEFMNSYKHLEKLCGEMFGIQHGISAYIEEMQNTPRGSDLINGWEKDLKQLKHYRWMRNRIVHDPDCSEESMCMPEDVAWLDDFYDRIMARKDPLSLYRKAMQLRSTRKTTGNASSFEPGYTTYSPRFRTTKELPRKPKSWAGWAILLLFAVLMGIFLLVKQH